MESRKITMPPADEAFFAACQELNVEPPRTIAERIAKRHGVALYSPLVDEISHALEDAMEIGRKLAPFENARPSPDLKASTQPTVSSET